jgi:hypothetical protein
VKTATTQETKKGRDQPDGQSRPISGITLHDNGLPRKAFAAPINAAVRELIA